MNGTFAIRIQQQVTHRHFPAKGDVRKNLLHSPCRIDRLARAQMQEIDVQAIGFIGQIGRNPDGKPFGVRRAGGTVGVQSRQFALALDNFRICVEDFGELAMKTDADVWGKFRIFRQQTLCRAHDEFEMGDVIALLVPDHQKFVLIGRPPVQTVSTIKHEYLE